MNTREQIPADVGTWLDAYDCLERELGEVVPFKLRALMTGCLGDAPPPIDGPACSNDVDDDALGTVEVGVAVRLSVATTSTEYEVDLTLPNLAAHAQLSSHDSRVGISVTGFIGPLGGMLPAPTRLDVEAYAVYVDAFERIQAYIFGETGLPFISPTSLSYET